MGYSSSGFGKHIKKHKLGFMLKNVCLFVWVVGFFVFFFFSVSHLYTYFRANHLGLDNHYSTCLWGRQILRYMVLLIANTTWEKYFLPVTKTVENKLPLCNTLYPKLVNVYKTLGVIQCIPGDAKLPLRNSSQSGQRSKYKASLQLLNKVAGPQWAVDHSCGTTHLMTKAAGTLGITSTSHVAELLTRNTIKLPVWVCLDQPFASSRALVYLYPHRKVSPDQCLWLWTVGSLGIFCVCAASSFSNRYI